MVAGLLGCLLPGAGQAYAGRAARGAGFLLALGLLFGLGVLMHARLMPPSALEDPLGLLRWAAQVAVGLPYVLARMLVDPMGRPMDPGYDYGNTFTEVAGLLNLLVILDAWDTASGGRRA